jgi:penicillin-binding protein 1A
MPAGMNAVWIDPATGVAADPGNQAAILEAFKPGSGPNLPSSMIGINDNTGTTTDDNGNAMQDVDTGGDANAVDLQDVPNAPSRDLSRGRGGLF